MVVSMQNGLGNVDGILSHGAKLCLVAPPGFGATRQASGSVECHGTGETWVAPLTSAGADAAREWVDVMNTVMLPARFYPDAGSVCWSKAVLNAAINPATALYGICNGDLPEHPEAWDLACEAAREAVAVARAAKIEVLLSDPLVTLRDVCRKTSTNRSSMLQDILAGRTTEIDQINGAIIREGINRNIPTPANLELLNRIRTLSDSRSRRAPAG